MIIIKTKQLEERLGFKLQENCTSVGVDTASRTGWCTIKNRLGEVTIDYGFIDIKAQNAYFKYDQMIGIFSDLLRNVSTGQKEVIVVIEDVFFGRNVNTLKMLARYGMIVYTISTQLNLKKHFILASTARAKIGFHGTAKKDFVHKQIADRLKLKLQDEDIVDALVLALTGLVLEKGLFNGKT